MQTKYVSLATTQRRQVGALRQRLSRSGDDCRSPRSIHAPQAVLGADCEQELEFWPKTIGSARTAKEEPPTWLDKRGAPHSASSSPSAPTRGLAPNANGEGGRDLGSMNTNETVPSLCKGRVADLSGGIWLTTSPASSKKKAGRPKRGDRRVTRRNERSLHLHVEFHLVFGAQLFRIAFHEDFMGDRIAE